MIDISVVDSNFKVETSLSEKDIYFIDVKEEPFKIYGIFYEDGKFRRLPENIAQQVSPGVHSLHSYTAGGRVRFATDSPYVAINVKMPRIGKMAHFPLTGSAGFDLYVCEEREKYISTFIPTFNFKEGFESIIYFETSEMREITINFPLYSDVSELYIGIKEGSQIKEGKPYSEENPIVYYGSSITQGGCASRPGNSYQNIISRRFNIDYINLGFSGNAKAEPIIADYINNLDMSVFVYDYDHNAPTIEHLINTHERMYNTIREKHPNLPIVLMSRPKYYLTDDEEKRLEVIKSTFDNAKARGDNNVYLIDGPTLMEMAKEEGTVDNCHPNDLGFYSIAKALGDVLQDLF